MSKPIVHVYDLGLIEYKKAFDLQKMALRRFYEGRMENTVLLLEHPPVYTIGRAGGEHHVLFDAQKREQMGISLFEADRGGDVTYHGPGQLVGYPLLVLDPWKNDVRQYVRMLEEVAIRLLAGYGIEAGRKEGMSGAWVGDEKICAIGVKVNRLPGRSGLVTSHGFAFNLCPDLGHFAGIVPCGIVQYGVTSLSRLIGEPVTMEELKRRWVECFAEVFAVEVRWPEGRFPLLSECEKME
jgi:lipoyl(octanoyl) transferase